MIAFLANVICTLLFVFTMACFAAVIIVGAVMMGKEKEQNHG